MRKKVKLKTKEEMEEILKETIKENNWDTLTSADYAEYVNVTDIGKKIIVKGKRLSGRKINEILEEMNFIKRDGKRIILTEKGKEYGRYAIAISMHSSKPLITDSGYAKYKKTVIPVIKEYLEIKSILEGNEKTITFKVSKESLEIFPKSKAIKVINKEEDEEDGKNYKIRRTKKQ